MCIDNKQDSGERLKMKSEGPKKSSAQSNAGQKKWIMKLYVAGQTAKSIAAFANLSKICDQHLKGKYRIEIIDVLKNPELAKGNQIIAIPTLIRQLPPPVKKIIGDLADTERVLVGLDLQSAEDPREKA